MSGGSWDRELCRWCRVECRCRSPWHSEQNPCARCEVARDADPLIFDAIALLGAVVKGAVAERNRAWLAMYAPSALRELDRILRATA